MRVRHSGGQPLHLSYCTNVHPAEDLPGILAQLDVYALPIRERLGADLLGLGLWLAAPAAAALAADRTARRRLRAELDARGLEVVTLNGFPYRAFQAPVVKYDVYHPDWTTPDRLRYTLDLARVLVDLLPDDAARGSISTLPLAWRDPWRPDQREAAARMLDRLASGLGEIEGRTGRTIRVGFEPEPGCIVETTGQAAELLSAVDTDRLGVCLDLAHLACAWEEPADALRPLADAGLPVVKVQVSAALEVADPVAAEPVLRQYAEPRFLHQTRSAAGPSADDLDLALAGDLPGPWRVHFHVPLHVAPAPPLSSTTAVIEGVLRDLMSADEPWCDHLDVETYTWDVLPADRRPAGPAELADGIAGELAWTRDLLSRVAEARS
ncbi:metabolite traffic protein EboE [Actinoplanes utahensis]|uniref:Xylose isomerase n=1 Tax=Actinoplanes utahensis TaxID=1869 RepID=A0A0A6X2N4_ACTUT|nr:metabolite traffic protein EboE [Actinoplanes utahensis]KHD74357.1 xylose isomerase [Actinoplanes utahensis]GIF35272.1 xylose isomerase [Actinoplanes utahensis]